MHSDCDLRSAMGWLVMVLLAVGSCLGCSSIGEKSSSWRLPFTKPADSEQASVDEESPLDAKQGLIEELSFIDGTRETLSRIVPFSNPGKSDSDAKLYKGHELFSKASTAQGDERRRLFDKAADAYTDASKRLKKSPAQEDAMFWMAESHFFADNYAKAAPVFDDLIKQYPNSRYLDTIGKRRFAVAQYWLELREQDSSFNLYPNLSNRRRPTVDTFGHVLRIFDRIRFDDPTGKLADDATMAAAVANYKRGRYQQADVLFDDLRENFPNSEHQFQTHLLQLECKRKLYEGPDYDGIALDESEKLIQQMVLQFPDKARDKRDFLEEVSKDIRLKKAQRDYELAKFYDRRKEFGAARMSYARVAEMYGDTNLAREAETRLAQLGGEPNMPEERLQWLADLFPDEEKPKPLIASDTLDTLRR